MAFLFKKRIKKRDYPDLDEYIKKHYIEDGMVGEPAVMGAHAMPAQAMPAQALSAMMASANMASPKSASGSFFDAVFRQSKKQTADACMGSAPPLKPLEDEKRESAQVEEIEEESIAEEAIVEESFEDDSTEVLMCASLREEAEDECLDFEEIHESRLEERIKHLSDTFSQYLMFLIEDKNMKNADVYKRAIVDKKVFSKIKNDINYHPQKQTALCLCVGAKLNLDESKDLLARAGYALSPCDKTDIIFSYFIENEIYDMIELDIQLEEHGLPCIIQ